MIFVWKAPMWRGKQIAYNILRAIEGEYMYSTQSAPRTSPYLSFPAEGRTFVISGYGADKAVAILEGYFDIPAKLLVSGGDI